jgi:hypothetical protein
MTSIALTPDGDLVSILDTHNGRPIFRKENPSEVEKAISAIIMAHPHPNVVNIYKVCDQFIDMELLSDDVEYVHPLDKYRAYTHFKKYGIVLVDWHSSAWGSDIYGIPKVQSFELAGLVDKTTGAWIYTPKMSKTYAAAMEEGHINPEDVDKWTMGV